MVPEGIPLSVHSYFMDRKRAFCRWFAVNALEEEMMFSVRRKNIITYVVPATLTNACIFLFTVVDGIFVGRGVGAHGLGAVNIAFPFIMICGALYMLTSVGGVTVAAIRLGRGDQEGANQAFMHSFTFTAVITAVLFAVGVFLTTPVARLLGSDNSYGTGLSVLVLYVYHSLWLVHQFTKLLPERRLPRAGGNCYRHWNRI